MNAFKIITLLILSISIMPAAFGQKQKQAEKTGEGQIKQVLEAANRKADQFYLDLFGADTLTIDGIIDTIASQLAGPINGAANAAFADFEAKAKKQAQKSPEKTKPYEIKAPGVKGELAKLLRKTIEKELPAAMQKAKQDFLSCRRTNGNAQVCKEQAIKNMTAALLGNIKTALKTWFEKKNDEKLKPVHPVTLAPAALRRFSVQTVIRTLWGLNHTKKTYYHSHYRHCDPKDEAIHFLLTDSHSAFDKDSDIVGNVVTSMTSCQKHVHDEVKVKLDGEVKHYKSTGAPPVGRVGDLF